MRGLCADALSLVKPEARDALSVFLRKATRLQKLSLDSTCREGRSHRLCVSHATSPRLFAVLMGTDNGLDASDTDLMHNLKFPPSLRELSIASA